MTFLAQITGRLRIGLCAVERDGTGRLNEFPNLKKRISIIKMIAEEGYDSYLRCTFDFNLTKTGFQTCF